MKYSETSQHTDTASPRLYLLAHFPGVHFDLAYSPGGFEIAVPAGVDWADYESQPDLEIPQPDDSEGNPVPPLLQPQPPIRHPRDPWSYYQQEYGIEADQPTPEEVLAWTPPAPEIPEQPPVTDVEMLYKTISERLNGDEAKRTGQPVDPNGAVPVARAMAATAMLYLGWHYPSEADLATGSNPAILQAIYADPTTNTTEGSTVAQKRKVLHFTLVMLEGQAFGLEYQAELGAYERTASGQFQAKLKSDKTRDWLDLPCPKMHKDWPEFDSVRSMFQAVMK